MEISVITKVEFKLNKNLDFWMKICPDVSKTVDKSLTWRSLMILTTAVLEDK